MIATAAMTDARRSEVIRLRWADVDFPGETLLLHEKKRTRGKRTTRRVAMALALLTALRAWQAESGRVGLVFPVERLGRGPAPTSELAAPFRMALPSFLQHLAVLQDCGLVRSTKTGQFHTYELTPDALTAAEDWLAKQRTLWERRLDQLDAFLNDLKEQSE